MEKKKLEHRVNPKKGKRFTFRHAQTSSRSLVLDVGEDRLVLTARPSLYHLDIFHPLLINQESSFAEYNSSTQVRNTQIYT